MHSEGGKLVQKTILVLGGTGTLGQPVSRRLCADGYRVRIMTRNPEKASKLFDAAFELVGGDPMDAAGLETAMAGCAGVHISLPGEVEQRVAEAVADLAPKQQVERITYISGATVAEENRWFAMVDRKFQAEQALRAGETPYTIFGPTWIMESLPLFVVNGRASVFGKQPCPYHWVAADDLAGMVSAAYGLDEAANQRFVVLGPEAIPMREALSRYCAAFEPGIKKVSSMPFWLVNLMATVTRSRPLKEVGAMMAYFEKVGEWQSQAQVNPILDAPTTTLDQWLARRKAARDTAATP